MRSRSVAVPLLIAGMLLAAAPATTAAKSGDVLFEGRAITVAEAATLACHDIASPVVRCFRSTAQMEADLRLSLTSGSTRSATIESSGYVIVYENANYHGASRTLSIDYTNLGAIGWNDRISSFKSFLAEGEFRKDSPPGGFIYDYSTSAQVPTLGATYNDAFSAFQID